MAGVAKERPLEVIPEQELYEMAIQVKLGLLCLPVFVCLCCIGVYT